MSSSNVSRLGATAPVSHRPIWTLALPQRSDSWACVSPARILLRHVLPVSGPQFLALAGISVSMAFGACIPVETLCDLPGIGQLAWKAAMARDLPVLICLTMMLTAITQLCNSASEGATA